jgi:hypothetical protein
MYEEYQHNRSGYDVNLGWDPAYKDAEVLFKSFSDGECKWACVVIQECPADTFPVITEDCFTCGLVNDEGEVVQAEC